MSTKRRRVSQISRRLSINLHPVLKWRLERSLKEQLYLCLLTLLILLCGILSIFRLYVFILANQYLQMFPEAFHESEVYNHRLMEVSGSLQRFEYSQEAFEVLAQLGHLAVVSVLFFFLFCEILFCPLFRLNRWSHPWREEMVNTPLSPRQRLLYLSDWGFARTAISIFIVSLFFLLPSRETALPLPVASMEYLPIGSDILYCGVSILGVFFLYSILRSLQLMFLVHWKLTAHPLLYQWLCTVAVTMILFCLNYMLRVGLDIPSSDYVTIQWMTITGAILVMTILNGLEVDRLRNGIEE